MQRSQNVEQVKKLLRNVNQLSTKSPIVKTESFMMKTFNQCLHFNLTREMFIEKTALIWNRKNRANFNPGEETESV